MKYIINSKMLGGGWIDSIDFRPSISDYAIIDNNQNINRNKNKTNKKDNVSYRADLKEGLRKQGSLVSNYESALSSIETNKLENKEDILDLANRLESNQNANEVDENQLKSKAEEIKNQIIQILEAASNKVSSIEQATTLNKTMELLQKTTDLEDVVNGVITLKQAFPDLANSIRGLLDGCQQVSRVFKKIKKLGKVGTKMAELSKELAKKFPAIKKILNNKVTQMLSDMTKKIMTKLRPFAKVAGIIGKALDAILSIKQVVDILISNKPIQEKGVDLADLIIRKVLDIGGTVALAAIGTAIGGPVGAAVGTIVGGILGLIGAWDFIANKLKDIGLTKLFANIAIIPVMKLFEKTSVNPTIA